ncbi:MAG: hypothetical protein OXC46_11955 [Thaumarchaeota archaeon]|nr:hypothetical protein [Nitrososphaerota archaeon]
MTHMYLESGAKSHYTPINAVSLFPDGMLNLRLDIQWCTVSQMILENP